MKAVLDAWDKNTGEGRDEEGTRALADAYVAAHPDEFVSLKDMTLDQCVQAVDVFRAAGMEVERARVDVWLWHRFEPQHIGGPVQARVRFSQV